MKNLSTFLVFGLLLFLLQACAVKQSQLKTPSNQLSKNEDTLSDDISELDLIEVGIASWYGPGFYGKKTASGEVFRKNTYTAAHKSLPFGTKLLVLNERNGKEVEVVVNDRGPFIKGRVLDLSFAAAKELGVLKPGHAPVKLLSLAKSEREQSSQFYPFNDCFLCESSF